MAAALAVGLAVSWAAGAEEAPVTAGLLLAREDGSCCEAAPSLGTAAHLVVTGALVRGQVTQVFVNPTDRTVEAVYVFPLLDGAAVYGFRMTVGERTIEGRVAERDAARQVYETAAAEGRKASLLERGSPDLFRLSVANLAPGEVVEVTLDFQHEVAYRDGRFSVRFPTVAPPRYGEGSGGGAPALPADVPVGLRVDLAAGFPLASVESPTHEIRIAEGAGGRSTVTLADDLVPSDRDFVLEWRPAIEDRVLTAVAVEDTPDGRYVVALLVPPPAEPEASEIARDVVFVLDTSGSMSSGGALDQARHAAGAALERLRPSDRFNLIRFSSDATALFEESRPADPFALAEARDFLASLAPDGGTEMLPALELALEGGYSAWNTVRQVIFVTDGQVADVTPFLSTLMAKRGDTRLFSVGIGAAPSSHFMRRAAEVGRGTATFIDESSRVAEEMDLLLRRLEGTVLRDVRLDWGPAGAEARPDPVPDLYAGEPLVVAARLDQPAESLSIEATTARGPWRVEVPLPPPAGEGTAGVARLWAQREVEALEASRLEGADADTVRDRVMQLALRFGLASEHTSFVAVDVTRATETVAAPADARPSSGFVATPGSGAASAEMITVTSESPLLDERRISRGTAVFQTELFELPWPGSPWSLAVRTPGIVVDRVDVAGVESLGQPALPGGDVGAAVAVRIDGLDVTSLAPEGEPSLVDLAFLPLEQVEVTLGGADAELWTAGPTLELVTKRGSNRFHGSAWAAWSDRELRSDRRAEAGGMDGLRALGADVGGPIARDRLWADVSGGGSRLDATAPFGGDQARSLDHAGMKVNAQTTESSSVMGFGRGSKRQASGVGSGPTRAPAATLDEAVSGQAYRLEGTEVFTADLYLTLGGGAVDRDDETVPAAAADPILDAAGVLRRGDFARSGRERLRSWDGDAHWYTSVGRASHEVVLGATTAEGESEAARTASDRGLEVRAGELYGIPGSTEVLAAWRNGAVGVRSRHHALWLDDTIAFGRLTLQAGLRWDRQEVDALGGVVAGNAVDPLLGPATSGAFDVAASSNLSPRLGATYTLDANRTHLLRASIGRFAGRLDAAIAGFAHPLRPAVTYRLFEDADGDLAPDPNELAGARFVTAEGVEPLLGGPTGAVASDLEPEITDEALVAYEWALTPWNVVGVSAAWRRTDGVFEERYRERDVASGEVSTATADDWVPAGTVTGSLPGGGAYEVPYFDLRPGLAWTGGRLLANGSRERESLSVTAEWTRRFTGSWMGRGHVTWSDARWRVPAAYARIDEPTPEAGGGDRDGQAVVIGDVGSAAFAQARWSLFAGAYYSFDSGVEVAGTVTGREGFPVVYYRRVLRERAGPVDVAVTGEPDAWRTGDLVTLDARVAKELDVGSTEVEVALEAFNLLDAGTVTAREGDLGSTRGGLVDDLVAPRTVRLSVRLEIW
jgi:Ca-activated chloride channel family protein